MNWSILYMVVMVILLVMSYYFVFMAGYYRGRATELTKHMKEWQAWLETLKQEDE